MEGEDPKEDPKEGPLAKDAPGEDPIVEEDPEEDLLQDRPSVGVSPTSNQGRGHTQDCILHFTWTLWSCSDAF